MLTLVAALLAQDYFPLGEGYTWTYAGKAGDREMEVVKNVSGKEKVGDRECFVVEDAGMGGQMKKMYFAPAKDGVWVYRMRREIKQPFIWMKLPVKKGDTWKSELESPDGDSNATLDYEVQNEEEVQVPAGKYKAWRVKVTGDDKKSKVEIISWYAADVGEVKRTVRLMKDGAVDRESSMELKKFEKGGK